LRFARLRFSLPANRLPPLTLHDALWWSLAVAIVVLGAQLFWMVVTPVSPLGDWRPASVRVMSPSARAALFAGFDPFNRNATPPPGVTGQGTVTALSLTLFGVRLNAATGAGSAIIAGPDGVQQVYRLGAEVMPGVILAGVQFDHVSLSHNGSTELLYLDQSKPVSPVAPAAALPPSQAGTSPTLVPPASLTVDSIKRGVSFQPHAENGRVMGFEVSATGDGSAFRGVGFQTGDVITGIGGKPVTGAADAAALSSALRPGASVAVTVRRNGQELPLAITLPQ